MIQFGNFLQKERVIRIMLTEPFQLLAGAGDVLMAKVVKSQQNTGKWHEKTAMISYQRQLFYTLFLVAFESAQAQHPADRRSFAADNIFAHSGSDVGVVILRRARQQSLCVAIGRLGIRERTKFFLRNEGGIVGAQTGDKCEREQCSLIVLALLQSILSQLFCTGQRHVKLS